MIKLGILREFCPYIMKVGSPAFRRKLAEWIPLQSVQDAIKIIDIMDATSRDIYAKKKEALALGASHFVATKGKTEIKLEGPPINHLFVTTSALPDWNLYAVSSHVLFMSIADFFS